MSLQGVDFGRKPAKREPRLSKPYVPGKRHEKFWTEAELDVLRRHYTSKGIEFCLDRLPNRTRSSAFQAAHNLGLSRAGRKPVRDSYKESYAEIDAKLKERWPTLHAKGALNAFADEIGYPRWLLSKRAKVLELTVVGKKQPPWTPAEDALLKRVPRHNLKRAAEIFASHGFSRTETAIMVRCKRVGLARRYRETLAATGIAKILGVGGKTVTTWIAKGWLAADRRCSRRLPQQGGAPHSVTWVQLRQFILDNLDLIDIRKVEKVAFVEVLTTVDPSSGCGAARDQDSEPKAASRPRRQAARSSRREST